MRQNFRSQGQKFARLVRPRAANGARAPRIVRSPHAGRSGSADPGPQPHRRRLRAHRRRQPAPARPAAAPTVVDVSVDGQHARPDGPHPGVVRTKVGEPFDPQVVDRRSARDQRSRLLRRSGAAGHQAASRRRLGHVPRGREPGRHEHPLSGQQNRLRRHPARADGHRDRTSLQPQDVSRRRPEDQFVLRQDRLRRSGALARHRRQHRHGRRADADDPRRPDGPAHHHRSAAATPIRCCRRA